jgi:hypothetical protein
MLARRPTLTALITIILAVGADGKTSVKSKETYIAGNYVAGSPPPVLCTPDEARQQSRTLAAMTPGAFVLSGTLLVVQPVAFENLSRGMSVVFSTRRPRHHTCARGQDGEWLAHNGLKQPPAGLYRGQ